MYSEHICPYSWGLQSSMGIMVYTSLFAWYHQLEFCLWILYFYAILISNIGTLYLLNIYS